MALTLEMIDASIAEQERAMKAHLSNAQACDGAIQALKFVREKMQETAAEPQATNKEE